MIHACNKRLWYVKDYLIPSMIEQGIKEDNIILWLDRENLGNLESCVRSFESVSDTNDGIWHLQDDIILGSNFKEKTEKLNTGLVCGFCCEYDQNVNNSGEVRVIDMWYSFPCIRIPNVYALEFSKWFRQNENSNFEVKYLADKKKNDDLLFRYWLERNFINDKVLCVRPNLVDHIDYLIGGSTVNRQRGETIIRSDCFDEPELIEELKLKISVDNCINV